jgi:hypothetical protein
MAPEVTALLIAFLQESDLVKFSEWTPDVESAPASEPWTDDSRGDQARDSRRSPQVTLAGQPPPGKHAWQDRLNWR